MNPNQALWEKGDFTRIAQGMRESGEALVSGLGITRGVKVLDLGCGDGTTALPAARLGADVSGAQVSRKTRSHSRETRTPSTLPARRPRPSISSRGTTARR